MLNPTDDDVDEANEALTVAGGTTATGFTVNGTTVTIADDDERGVSVTASTLAVPEGGSGTYTVALTSEPTGTVTVTPSVSGNSEVTVSGALTFTASDWNQAQTVTVSAQDDADAVNDTATVAHTVSGADYGTVTASDVSVTVTDDETVSTEVTLTVDPATLDEGDGATTVTVTGTLNGGTRDAATAVTVSVGASDDSAVEGTDYATVEDLTLTIGAGQTAATQTFMLNPTDDDVDEANEALTVAGGTTATGFTVNGTTVTIADDDERGVSVTASTLAVPEGGSGTYTVALTSEPTGTVTVTPSVSGNSEVTVSGALTFTASDWNQAQTVTVSAQDDADAVNDTATVAHTVSGADYGTVTASDVSVTVTDDETVSTEVTLTVDPATLDEGDGATTVTVTGTLNGGTRDAATAVTVSVGASDDSAVEGTDYATVEDLTLTIGAGQTAATQTFMLNPTDDDVDEANEALTVAGGTTATGFTVNGTTVTIADDDERGVSVMASTLAVPEGGSGTYTVALTSEPTGTVTVTPSVSGNSEVTVSGALTFTASDWNQAQTVTVSAQDDADAVNDTATVAHTVSGADYGTVTASDVSVTVTDDETVSTEVTLTVDPATLDEGDGATTVTVTGTLNGGTRDAATAVTVSVGASDDSAVEGTDYATVEDLTLTIGAGQTAATQTFMLNPTDDDVDEANEALTVAGGTTATGFTVNGTTVTIADDDERGVSVTASTLAVPEGGSGTYTVALTSEPTGTVTVTPSVSGNSEVTVSGALTFTASDWNQAQTVTVSAQDDADAVNDTATVAHTVSGADYGTVTASDVSVTVTDDETVSTEVTLTVDPATLDEGDGATTVTVTGTLNGGTRDAATAVTVSVGASDDSAVEGTDYATVEDLTLTIGAGQTAATQTFMLNPTDDDVDEANEALTVAGGTTATGFTVNGTTVTIADDDERGVSVTASTLAVPEGGSGTYTVALTSEPTGTVTVTPSVSGNSEVTVSGALTFTASDWNQAQTVTVSAQDDADAVNDTATVAHTVSGADYGTVTASDVSVTVTDDETVSTGVVLSVNPEKVSEDAGATEVTVTAALNHAPRLVETAVTVTVGDTGDAATEGTDYGTIWSATLTIAAGSTSGTATFMLTPTDDDVDEGDEALTVDGSVTGLDVTAAALTIEEDDERGVTVTPTVLTVPEGASASYTVVLGSQPTGSVTVTPSRSGSSDVTVAPSPLTFTTGNWSTAQTVTVSAAADSDAADDTATVTHAVSGGDYGTVTAEAVAVTVSDEVTVFSGRVTGLSATAKHNKVSLAWTAPQGAILGYRIEVSHDSGSLWADVEANTNSTDTSYAHGSGLMAGETRHYRVSAITEDGSGTPSAAVEANATDTVDGLTATGLAIEDTPNGMATIDLCWKPTGVAASDLKNFAIRKRHIHPSYPAEWSDQHWSPRSKSTAADCEAGSIGFRVTGSIAPNIRYAYQIRARYGMRWALSNDAEAVSVNTALELRADVLTGNSSLSVDTDVPATVCPAYDDPATPEADAGSFIVNIGFSTGPAVLLNYEAVTGFVLDNDVTLENATAELIDRPYGAQLGYRVRITPTTWGQPVAVSVPAGVVTHPESSVPNQASNVFQRDTSAATDCDTGSDITVYPPAVRRAEILDDDDRSGMWSTGERVRATLEFTEPVTVTTDNGIPTVSLSIDGETVQASYAEGAGSDKLVFEHVVTAEQGPFNSASLVANSLSLNGGAIASLDGPAAALAHPGAVKRKKPATKPKLTAEWVKFPPGHSGDGRKFTVRVKFSDPVTINVRYFREYALSVTGGAVDKVWRVKGSDGERRSDMWAIRVMPTSQQQLSLSLAAIQDCKEHGAICTADGTPLSNAASITVTGPNHDLTVEDAEVEEGPGAALAFLVTLSGTAPYRVKVDYATSDGTATAGSDYTATSGTLIFERGETSKTISVPVLDDAHDDDSETLTLSLSNPLRAMIVDGEAVGTIRNSDHMPKAWIARFGRTVADQVLDAVDARLKAARTAGMSLSLGGQTIGGAVPKADERSGAATDGTSASLFGGTAAADAGETVRVKVLSDWLSRETAENDRSSSARTLTGRDLLMGSSFSLAAQTGGGGFAALWGRMAQTSFAAREGSLSLDGDVTTGLLGADYASGRWTTGLVVSHSNGDGDYRGENSGEIEASVTALTPWAGYAVTDRLSVWGAAGYGAGDLTLTPQDDAALKTDLGMMLAAAGARGTLIGGDGDGPRLDAVTDARWVRTTTARVSAAAGKLESAAADVTRLRLGLEGSWPLALGDGAVVTPRLALGVRHDGGDAETGFGADFGGGVTLEAPARGLTVSLEGRGVLTHEASGFRDRGLAGSLAWNPPPSTGRGPKLTLSQTIGAGASGGKDALLSRDTLEGLAANENVDGRRRLEARFGYGFPMFGDRFTGTPEIGLGLSDAGRDYGLGWRLMQSGSGAGSLELLLEARRRESANDNTPPEHGIGFRLTARF